MDGWLHKSSYFYLENIYYFARAAAESINASHYYKFELNIDAEWVIRVYFTAKCWKKEEVGVKQFLDSKKTDFFWYYLNNSISVKQTVYFCEIKCSNSQLE